MLKFHFDESAPVAAAQGLRERGMDVTLPKDVGLRGAPDPEHLEFATSQQRVVFTCDADFLRLAQADHEYFGVAYCPNLNLRIGRIVRALELLSVCYETNDMKGRIEFLESLGDV